MDFHNRENGSRLSPITEFFRRMGCCAAILALIGAASAVVAQTPRTRGSELRPDLIYHNYCSVCHGDRGDGRSRARASLNPPPADLTTAEARKRFTRDLMIAAVTYGKSGTAMTSWSTQLSPGEIEAVVDFVRDTMMAPEPGTPLARGRSVYGHQCMSCHGERGQGAASTAANPAPGPLGAADRERMIDAVARGRPGADGHAFEGRLQRADIENVVDYIRRSLVPALLGGVSGTRAHGGRDRDGAQASAKTGVDMTLKFANGLVGNAGRGKRLYMANCATCHGPEGDGNGPRAYFIRPRPRNFLVEPARAAFNRPALFAAVSLGRAGTEMPAWDKVLTEQQVADVSEYVLQAYIRPVPQAQRR